MVGKRFYFWFVLLSIIILFVIGSSFWVSRQLDQLKTKDNLPNTRIFPSDIITNLNSPISNIPSISPTHDIPLFKILHQNPGDSEGRTIVYESSTTGTFTGYGGSFYSVEYFVGWQSIKGTSDRNIIVSSNPDGSNPHVGGRVVFERSFLFQMSIPYNTWIIVEDLNKINSGQDWSAATQSIYDLSITDNNTLDSVLRSGDAVALLSMNKGGKIIKDDKGINLIFYIGVRRFRSS